MDSNFTEYNSLRDELNVYLTRIREDERNSMVVTGFIWAWVSRGEWNDFYAIVIFIPFIITILLFIRSKKSINAINNLSAFIANIESTHNQYFSGWHNHISESPENVYKYNHRLFWILLIMINLTIAVLISTRLIVI